MPARWPLQQTTPAEAYEDSHPVSVVRCSADSTHPVASHFRHPRHHQGHVRRHRRFPGDVTAPEVVRRKAAFGRLRSPAAGAVDSRLADAGRCCSTGRAPAGDLADRRRRLHFGLPAGSNAVCVLVFVGGPVTDDRPSSRFTGRT